MGVFAAALVLGLFSSCTLAAVEGSTPPVSGSASFSSPTAPQAAQRKRVLILSATQYGLPVSDAVIAGAVAALKSKGFSVNDFYVEHLAWIFHRSP